MTIAQAQQLVVGDRVISDFMPEQVGTVSDTERAGLTVEFPVETHFYRFADARRLESLTKVEAV